MPNDTDDEESTVYSLRQTNFYNNYPCSQAFNEPPFATVISGKNEVFLTPTLDAFRKELRTTEYHRADKTPRKTTSKNRKESTFHSDITTTSLQDTKLGFDDRQDSICFGRMRRFWCCALVMGIFCLGLGIGVSSRRGATKEPTQASTRNATDILVGAYYYPWYGDNFHNGDGYLRSQLEPPQYPTLGEYDDSKPEIISQHLKWSRQANIGLWVTSWWGPYRLEDNTTKNVIMEHEELGNLKISIHYETTGRVRDGNMENVESDIQYMCDNYFDHRSYYHIDGRPVIFLYVARVLEMQGLLEQTILMMRLTANRCGKSIFIVGDYVFGHPPDGEDEAPVESFLFFDAVTNYDMYGAMGSQEYYAGSTVLTDYYFDQKGWKDLAAKEGCRYMPTVSPGFNDRGVRPEADHKPLSRRLTANSLEGSLFAMAVAHAKRLVDPTVDNLLLVNSFNEWHEDSQIEPCNGATASAPEFLTGGLDYEGYGELYLDILREGTQPRDKSEEDNIFRQFGR